MSFFVVKVLGHLFWFLRSEVLLVTTPPSVYYDVSLCRTQVGDEWLWERTRYSTKGKVFESVHRASSRGADTRLPEMGSKDPTRSWPKGHHVRVGSPVWWRREDDLRSNPGTGKTTRNVQPPKFQSWRPSFKGTSGSLTSFWCTGDPPFVMEQLLGLWVSCPRRLYTGHKNKTMVPVTTFF